MYINTETLEYPVTESQIRDLFPNTSFPSPFRPPENYQVVFPTPQPEFNQVTEMAVEDTPVFTVKAHWEQTWKVVSRFQEYTDGEGIVHTVAEQEAAAIAADAELKKQQLIEQVTTRTQQRLDDFAKTRNYDGILSAATYATSTNPKFQTEGQYAVEARDATWAKLYEILAEVEAGARPAPTSYEEIEPELPVLQWTN